MLFIDLSVRTTVSKSPFVIINRVQDVLCYLEHSKGTWLILSNIGGSPDLQLWKTKVNADSEWVRLINPNTGKPLLDGIPIENFVTFERH